MANNENETNSPAPDSLLMDVNVIADLLSIGVRTLWRLVSAGIFPAPDVTIGSKIVRWKRTTLLAWLDCEKRTADCMKQTNGDVQ